MGALGKLEDELSKRIISLGYDVVDIRWTSTPRGKTLSILADKDGGITVVDCEMISREASDLLDQDNWGLGHYQLEVSSPGLNRPLKKYSDFERFKGSKVSVQTQRALEGRKRFRGRLKRVEERKIFIEIDQQLHEIPYEEIQKANLVYEEDTSKKR